MFEVITLFFLGKQFVATVSHALDHSELATTSDALAKFSRVSVRSTDSLALGTQNIRSNHSCPSMTSTC